MANTTLQRLLTQIGTASNYTTTERLDSVNYSITLYTVVVTPGYADNPATRTGYWNMDLRDSVGNPIVLGLGLGSGVDLLFPFRANALCPPGKLFVWTNDGRDPGLDSFAQKTAVLYYQPISQVLASGGTT